MLEVTAFSQPRDYGEHFGPLRPDDRRARERARDGREAEFDAALDASATSGTAATDDARFEQEYLVAVGTRR